MTESRAAMILRWEREGRLDPNCPGCHEPRTEEDKKEDDMDRQRAYPERRP